MDLRIVEIAYNIAGKMDIQSIATDTIRQRDKILVLEVTSAYAEWTVRKVRSRWGWPKGPGHTLEWLDRDVLPEGAVLDGSIARVAA